MDLNHYAAISKIRQELHKAYRAPAPADRDAMGYKRAPAPEPRDGMGRKRTAEPVQRDSQGRAMTDKGARR